jgi:hypothetical protein
MKQQQFGMDWDGNSDLLKIIQRPRTGNPPLYDQLTEKDILPLSRQANREKRTLSFSDQSIK